MEDVTKLEKWQQEAIKLFREYRISSQNAKSENLTIIMAGKAVGVSQLLENVSDIDAMKYVPECEISI